jgi:hypothetical protein
MGIPPASAYFICPSSRTANEHRLRNPARLHAAAPARRPPSNLRGYPAPHARHDGRATRAGDQPVRAKPGPAGHRADPAGGLDERRLPAGRGRAVRSANAHAVQRASCPGHVAGCLTGQSKVRLLPADGRAHHADDPGDYTIGFGLAPGSWLALVTGTCSLAAGVRVLAGARAAAGSANHSAARREGGWGPAAHT